MMTIKKVFLSSTARDLADYRQAAYKAIEGLEGYHCVRMEDFGAHDWAADDFCRAKVGECDLFVGIVGHLYGSCPPGSEQSYTEREYEAAVAAEVPRLIFIAPEDFPLPVHLIESDEVRRKQRAFRERVSQERIRDTFTSPTDLAWRMVQAIRNWEQEQRRPPAARPEGVMPLPPQPCFAHPYPLQANFTGRVRERQMLSDWLTRDERPILALVAIGGMGKSALTWAWLQRDVLGLPLPGLAPDQPEVAEACRLPEAARPEGVLWWSFYEREARCAAFLDRALAYAGGGSVDPAAIPSAYEKARTLLTLLQRRRLLLVLDGFERELRAYASLDAAYQGDVVARDAQGDFRACTDPHAGDFLRWLAALPMKSRVLLTSRLFPRELDGLAGCRPEELTALDPQDAVAFFHAQGIKGTRAEIQDACAPYGYHPLALRLLAGMIVEDKRIPGDVRVASCHPVLPELKGKEQHHILQVAYNALDRKKRTLLSRISAFRSPMTYDALAIFNEFANEDKFDKALDELIGRGLLTFDRGRGRYDLHPIVRRHAYDHLADKIGTHTHLRDYFAAAPAPEAERVQSVEDLAPTIELYHHTVRAGRYDEACVLFYDRLAGSLYFRFGAYQACIELLRALFADGEERPPRLVKESAQAWTLNELAGSYALSGQPRRAVPLVERSIAIDEREGVKVNVAIGLENLASHQFILGELAPAERNLRRSIELGSEVGDKFWEAVGHLELGRLLAYRGAFAEAEQHLTTAQRVFDKIGGTNYVSVVRSYHALCALLLGQAGTALDAARGARELADVNRFEHDAIQAEWLLGTALVNFSQETGFLTEAETHLTEALTRCRRINLVELEPDILLAWARWHRARGEAPQAHQYAEEALAIADRCEYRLKQADIHVFLAQWELAEGNAAEACRHADIAKERAWCDGPPHCYKPALDEAERLLK
jgi:tetratricopeptide (TPR) repeat protein